MKNYKISIALAFIILAVFSLAAFAGGPGLEAPKNMTLSETLQMVFTALFMAIIIWLEPKVRNMFARSDEEAEKRIKLIDNQRIAGRLQDARAGMRKAAEAALTDFIMALSAEQKKDGIISQSDLTLVSKNAAESFIRAESNSTSDLMKDLGQDLYEVAAQEVKEIASRIWARFRPANPGEVRPAAN